MSFNNQYFSSDPPYTRLFHKLSSTLFCLIGQMKEIVVISVHITSVRDNSYCSTGERFSGIERVKKRYLLLNQILQCTAFIISTSMYKIS